MPVSVGVGAATRRGALKPPGRWAGGLDGAPPSGWQVQVNGGAGAGRQDRGEEGARATKQAWTHLRAPRRGWRSQEASRPSWGSARSRQSRACPRRTCAARTTCAARRAEASPCRACPAQRLSAGQGARRRIMRRAFASTRFCRPSLDSCRWYTCGAAQGASASGGWGRRERQPSSAPSPRWCRC